MRDIAAPRRWCEPGPGTRCSTALRSDASPSRTCPAESDASLRCPPMGTFRFCVGEQIVVDLSEPSHNHIRAPLRGYVTYKKAPSVGGSSGNNSINCKRI